MMFPSRISATALRKELQDAIKLEVRTVWRWRIKWVPYWRIQSILFLTESHIYIGSVSSKDEFFIRMPLSSVESVELNKIAKRNVLEICYSKKKGVDKMIVQGEQSDIKPERDIQFLDELRNIISREAMIAL